MEFQPGQHEAGDQVRQIHARKTGALFDLAGKLVALVAGASESVTHDVQRFTAHFGRAYQLIDDLQDRDAPGEARANLARIEGADAIRAEAHACLDAAHAAAAFDANGHLAACVEWLRGGLHADS